MQLLVAFGLEATGRQLHSYYIDIFSETVDERPCGGLLLSCDAEGAGWIPENWSDFAQKRRQLSSFL